MNKSQGVTWHRHAWHRVRPLQHILLSPFCSTTPRAPLQHARAYPTHCTAGDGSLANELLPRTKGHGMGYGFVSLSFGIAFFFSILCFGYISAYMVGRCPVTDDKFLSRRKRVSLVLTAYLMLSARLLLTFMRSP